MPFSINFDTLYIYMHGADFVGSVIFIFAIGAGLGYYVARIFFGV